MTTPNFKLKDDHVATCGHVRGLYQKVVDEFHAKNEDIIMAGTRVKGLGFMEPGAPTLNAPDRSDAVPKNFLYDNFAQTANVYDRDYIDEQLDEKLNVDGTKAVTGTLTYAQTPILLDPLDIPSIGVVQSLLDLKRDLTATDTKIQNSTGKTQISCDTDRYISIKSNGNKICDVIEDEENQGMTILTAGSKRFNVVSGGPQTYYHNSPAGLINFKYTDDGNTTAGQARFGQIQLAPSNTTNLNPAVTIVSSRVNGLGVAGAVFLDSAYGTPEVPLIIAPESISNTDANTLTMLSNGATVPDGVRTLFSKKTGYNAGVVVDQPLQFVTKQYVDSSVSGVPQPDLTPYVLKAGDTMTGNLSIPEPTEDAHASTKKYVDDQIDAIPVPDLTQITGDTVTIKTDFLSVKNKVGDETQFEVNPSVAGFSVPVIYTDSLFRPTQDSMLANKAYVDEAIDDIPEPDLTPFIKKDGTVAMTGTLDMGTNKLINLTTGVNPTESVNKGYVDGEDAVLQGQIDNITNTTYNKTESDDNYYAKTVPLNLITQATGTVNLNSQKISGLADGVGDSEAVNRGQVNQLIAPFQTQTQGDDRYYLKTTPLNSITTPTGNVAMAGFKITGLGAPTSADDAVTKNYVDSISSAGDRITSDDGTKRVVATNTSIDFQENNLAHLGVRSGQLNTTGSNYEINSTASTAVSNKLTFRSTGVASQAQFYALNFSDAGDRKTRVGSQGTSATDVYVDLSLTNQQVQIPDTAKLTRKDISVLNFQDQEYITKAYAQSLLSGSMISADGSVATMQDNGLFTAQTAGGNERINLNTQVGEINQVGNSALTLKSKPDISASGGSLILLSDPDGDLHSRFDRAVGYTSGTQALIDNRQFVPKGYVDTQAGLKVNTGASLSVLGAPTSNFGFGDFRLKNVADPVDPQDVATRAWTLARIGEPKIISFRMRCGNVPFTSGSAGNVNTFTVNTTNFPYNEMGIVQSAQWVRQAGRSDTIRFRIVLNSALTGGRAFRVHCQNETQFTNTSGGPNSLWHYGDSTENYIVQTFDQDALNSRFGIHLRDLGNATSQSLVLNCEVIF